MKLGAFSISLGVNDLSKSKEFYEKLGFSEFAGSQEQNYVIMKNGDTIIGLFQGMFQGNIMTFNPGWDQDAKELNEFQDVRSIQSELLKQGVEIEHPVDESGKGPASFMILDPDGNTILIDQHAE